MGWSHGLSQPTGPPVALKILKWLHREPVLPSSTVYSQITARRGRLFAVPGHICKISLWMWFQVLKVWRLIYFSISNSQDCTVSLVLPSEFKYVVLYSFHLLPQMDSPQSHCMTTITEGVLWLRNVIYGHEQNSRGSGGSVPTVPHEATERLSWFTGKSQRIKLFISFPVCKLYKISCYLQPGTQQSFSVYLCRISGTTSYFKWII